MNKKMQKIAPVDDSTDIIVKDLKINQIIPNVIDNFLIAIIDDHHTLVIPSNITGEIFRIWKRTRSGIFSKDVLKYSLKQDHGKYIRIKSADINCVARVISEEELDYFESVKLIDGKIKDTHYMILKNLQNGEKLTDIRKNINEKEISHSESETMTMNAHSSMNDDETNYHTDSISLLD